MLPDQISALQSNLKNNKRNPQKTKNNQHMHKTPHKPKRNSLHNALSPQKSFGNQSVLQLCDTDLAESTVLGDNMSVCPFHFILV